MTESLHLIPEKKHVPSFGVDYEQSSSDHSPPSAGLIELKGPTSTTSRYTLQENESVARDTTHKAGDLMSSQRKQKGLIHTIFILLTAHLG